MDGLLNVNKPEGPTSHDVVARLRRAIRPKRIGHAGTLDPMASGVLLVCIGNATKIVEYLMDWPKSYRAQAVFGVETDTEDATGNILNESGCSHLTRDMVESILPDFTGPIMQVPPMVSALHHEGCRLYELARAGKVVERKPRSVEIHSLRLLDFIPGSNAKAVLEVDCSKGTYIRTLCADIGRALGCGGHMSGLIRTGVGKYRLEEALTIEEIEERNASGRLGDVLHSIDHVLDEMPSVKVSSADAELIVNGVFLPSDRVTRPENEVSAEVAEIRIHGPNGVLLGLGRFHALPTGEVVLKPNKIFARAG